MNSVEISRFDRDDIRRSYYFCYYWSRNAINVCNRRVFRDQKKDPKYIALAKRWSKGYTITVAVGVVTGTIIGLQLSLVWPTFMKMGGHVIALPLFMETFAFFFEAIFLSIYLYTWNRFKINGYIFN